MTHSIKLIIKTKNKFTVDSIEKLLLKSEGLEQYGLIKGNFSYCMKNGNHPHIYFPENDEDVEDGFYNISFQSGSHCAIYDTPFSSFMGMFYHILLTEIESNYIEDWEYIIYDENDCTTYNDIQAFWEELLKHDKKLNREIK